MDEASQSQNRAPPDRHRSLHQVPHAEAANQGGEVRQGAWQTTSPFPRALTGLPAYQYPTRKIYMLYHLEPSVEMTGGPWYTDNELDTEFIKLLCSASLRFIRDRVRSVRMTSNMPFLFPVAY